MSGATAGLVRGRAWCLDAERRVHVLDTSRLTRAVFPPAPAGAIAACDPGAGPLLVYHDGRVLRAFKHSYEHFDWRVAAALSREVVQVAKSDDKVVVAAGTDGPLLWLVDGARRVWIHHGDTGSSLFLSDVPGGDVPIMGVDIARRVVLLGDGSRWWNEGGVWLRLGSVFDGSVPIRATVLHGFVAGGASVAPGDTVELDESALREQLRLGRVRPLASVAP